MRTFIFIIIAIFVSAFLIGCGSTQTTVTGTGVGEVPDWYGESTDDTDFLRSSKSAVSTDMQMSIDKAINDGRAEIARQLEVRVNSIEQRFREEVGTAENAQYLEQFTSANKQITANVLNGSKVKKQTASQVEDSWRSYVLMELPLGAMKEAMLDKIKKNEQMYTRFRATQVFKELDDEVKKFEDWKKEQEK
ncbi:MAG: LPP20 family lipoprotein [Ignavibacteriae bacterium]|nr:LPP20 family lipoprotein [Ignavibacteriota bacterium]